MAHKDAQSTKPVQTGRFVRPRVTLVPNLRGARVIEGENGGEQLLGKIIPWYRIVFQSHQGGTSVWLRDGDGRLLKIHNKSVWVSIKNRANAAQRAQQRHILGWVRSSDEPITFIPKEASIWGITILTAMMVPSFGYLYVQVFSQFQHFPPQDSADWFAAFLLTILTLAALIMSRFMFVYRHRKQRFESIDLLPSGFVSTLLTGEIITVDFDERSKPRLRRGDPLRLEFTAGDGQRMSFAVPMPVSTYLRRALNPPTMSQAESRRLATKKYYWTGLRVIVAGILVSVGFYFLAGWLGQTGFILPQDAARMQRVAPAVAGLPVFLGLLMMFTAWKHTNHGLRTRSRIARWFQQRKKSKESAAADSKD